jgi:hypothetical protein
MNILFYIIKLNGIYDILCAISILKWIPIPYIKDLHLSMIKESHNLLFERFFAYWIFTYGIIRLSNNYLLNFLTQLIYHILLNHVILQFAGVHNRLQALLHF